MEHHQRLTERIARNQNTIEMLVALASKIGGSEEIDERIARFKRLKAIQERLLGVLLAEAS